MSVGHGKVYVMSSVTPKTATVPWPDGPLIGFDTETTGVDVGADRIVTAAIVEQIDGETRVFEWLINPGVEIPQRATDVHGVTTQHAAEHGLDPREGLHQIADHLAGHLRAGRPIVAFNVVFDLSILDAELRRHELPTLGQRIPGEITPVLDPLVIDRRLDRYRRGKRTLSHLCEFYNVVQEGELHRADVDVAATLAVLRALCEKYAELGEKSLEEMHAWQIDGHRAWAENFREFLKKNGRPHDGVELDWPHRRHAG